MVNNKFVITNIDKRNDFIKAFEDKTEFITQLPPTKSIEGFDPNYGFYLIEKNKKINFEQKQIKRAYAIAKLHQRFPTQLGLREAYYIMERTQPDLYQYYEGIKPNKLNDEYIDRMNTLEILANVDRIKFTISTMSKGNFFYPFGYYYNDVDRKVGFTEKLASETIQDYEIPDCQSFLILEKSAAFERLIIMDFPKIINAAMMTVGGMFNRGIFRITKRFETKYPLIYFCDGDVFGAKMTSLIPFGSKRSRHLDLRSRHENIRIAGLFPSVGEKLGLPNDKSEKRPLNSEEARMMLNHLKIVNIVDDRDIETWERNMTYELESLSAEYLNDKKEPIGLGIYLIEYYRLNEIQIKPMPTDRTAEIFKEELEEIIKNRLTPEEPEIFFTFLTDAIHELRNEIKQEITDFVDNTYTDVLNENQDTIDDFINDLDDDLIKDNLILQYCEDIKQQKYRRYELIDNTITEASCEIEFDNNLVEDIQESIDEIMEKATKEIVEKLSKAIKPKIKNLLDKAVINSNVEFNELDDETEVCDLYDRALKEIGAKMEEAELIRNALKVRLSVRGDN